MRSNAKLVSAECQRRSTNATEVVPLCTGTWCFSISVRKSQWLMVRFGDDSTMWIAVLLAAVAVLFAIARVEAVGSQFPPPWLSASRPIRIVGPSIARAAKIGRTEAQACGSRPPPLATG